MLSEEVLQCALPSWIGKFQAISIPSIVIPLTDNALAYFQENGTVVIPEDDEKKKEDNLSNFVDDFKLESTNLESSETADVEVAQAPPDLSDFGKKIKESIKILGGSVFPKLNWSSPKDASWISFNKSLRCETPADIYLLLKSSTFVAHDLTCPFKDCQDDSSSMDNLNYSLVLRKWQEINPADEFRCFVKNKTLVGISQRDISQFYPSIKNSERCIKEEILSFWEENVQNFFPLSSYVFDVYRPASKRVVLLDFSPYGVTTDSLLFTWKYLLSMNSLDEKVFDIMHCVSEGRIDSNKITHTLSNQSDVSPLQKLEFRIIENNHGIQPNDLMQYGVPSDLRNFGRELELESLSVTEALLQKCQE